MNATLTRPKPPTTDPASITTVAERANVIDAEAHLKDLDRAQTEDIAELAKLNAQPPTTDPTAERRVVAKLTLADMTAARKNEIAEAQKAVLAAKAEAAKEICRQMLPAHRAALQAVADTFAKHRAAYAELLEFNRRLTIAVSVDGQSHVGISPCRDEMHLEGRGWSETLNFLAAETLPLWRDYLAGK